MAHTNGHDATGSCAACAAPQLARNNYFTGKLLVERDFREEQEYLLGKDRRHNHALHGWGTACGLKVKQHPDPACRERYVIVEPGTAIDCCGHEILVERDEYFDLLAHVPAEWLADPPDPGAPPRHKLQICLRSVECPTEDVPALFDECGCDEDGCKPNRIRDAYDLELVLDAPGHAHEGGGPRLDRLCTISIDDAWRIAIDEPARTLHVLTRTSSTDDCGELAHSFAVTSYSTEDQRQVQPTLAGDGRALDVAVSTDGSRIFVAAGEPGGDLYVYVYDSGGPVTPQNTLAVYGAGDAEAMLATGPTGRLYALVTTADDSELHAWDDPSCGTAPTQSSGPFGAAGGDVVVTPDGAKVIVATLGGDALRVCDGEDVSQVEAAALDVNAAKLSIAQTSAGTRLYAARTDHTLRVFGVVLGAADPFPPVTGPASLGTDPPIGIAVAAAGRFAYVLTRTEAAFPGRLLAVDTYRLDSAPNEAVRATLTLDGPLDMLLTAAGRRIYAAYDEGDEGYAGVAVIGVSEADCGELFERTIEGCPACEGDDCVVLATIADYEPGQAIVDADIDNLSDRRLLPSTTVITDVVRCMLEHGGEGGAPGPQGPPGLGIADVTGEFVDGLADAGVDFDGAARVVDLKLPKIADVDGEFVDTLPQAGVDFDPQTGLVHLRLPKGADGAPGLGIADVTGQFVDGLASAGVDFDTTTRVVDLRVPKIADVTGEFVDTLPQAGVDFDAQTGLVHLRLPKGEKGDPGDPVRLELPTIVAVNWPHAGSVPTSDLVRLRNDGLVIAFDRDVLAKTLTADTFEVLYKHASGWAGVELQIRCACAITGRVTGLKVDAGCGMPLDELPPPDQDVEIGDVRAARFVPTGGTWVPGDYVVLMHGDFVLGSKQITLADGRTVNPAVDANHLGPGLPFRCPTGDGVEGGTFRSWFTIE